MATKIIKHLRSKAYSSYLSWNIYTNIRSNITYIPHQSQLSKSKKCDLQPALKLARLLATCKSDGISSQRRGSEINMELKKEEVFADWCKSLVLTNLLGWMKDPREVGANSFQNFKTQNKSLNLESIFKFN